jgi:hypothetical protein
MQNENEERESESHTHIHTPSYLYSHKRIHTYTHVPLCGGVFVGQEPLEAVSAEDPAEHTQALFL